MCWNENISLNTFLFGTGALVFIYYVCTYTQYKLVEFANPYLYLACFSFIVMQGIEFFLWKSIRAKDRPMNRAFSVVGWLTLYLLQPISFLLLLSYQYSSIRFGSWLALYVAVFVIVFGYKLFSNTIDFTTTVGQNGHLNWNWNDLHGAEYMISVLYFVVCFSAVFVLPWITMYFLLLLLLSVFIYGNTFNSMWCWIVNSVMLFFLIKILFVLPFKEYRALC